MAQQVREAIEHYLAREERMATPRMSLEEITRGFPDLPPDDEVKPLDWALADAILASKRGEPSRRRRKR
ncbi:MAG: hypothetical protein ACREOF_13295 [Gemmatimonadales bacterium]